MARALKRRFGEVRESPARRLSILEAPGFLWQVQGSLGCGGLSQTEMEHTLHTVVPQPLQTTTFSLTWPANVGRACEGEHEELKKQAQSVLPMLVGGL